MAFLAARVNDALEINPPAGDQFLTVNGSNWLWTVTAIYVVSFLAIYGLSFIAPKGEKFFHYLFTIANLVGAITYYAQASDLAWSLVDTTNSFYNGATYQLFFAKYILWVVSFPTAILALGVLSGVAWTTIIFNIFLAWTWIIGYLVAAYTESSYKWGFFGFATAAYIFLAVSTLADGLKSATRVGVRGDYLKLAGWLNLLWILYPIAWGLTDGGNRIKLTSSFIFFGILDVLMIPVLTFAVVALSRKWDYGKLNIAFTQYGRVAKTEGVFPEKEVLATPAAAAPTGEQAA
ncbi:heat shock protein 30 [Lasiosphaeris hirsuta]|uniref:Heat shock protein 30 n=1 Tax=Lasiosphaeris hirsuta TaxID=260670 RepID=A0AA39ZWR8_9PEZI|nr:heat shock protein 30 [Lasiosphaeris hirsuta]